MMQEETDSMQEKSGGVVNSKALQPWKSLGRQVLLAVPPWFEVIREQVELPSGRIVDDFYRIVLPDFALIVPVTPEGKIVMVRGYKHGVGRINLSPPAR